LKSGPEGLRAAADLWKGVRREILALIGLWFLTYVVFDLASTYWLVTNSSLGIAGELNPLGLALYRSFGYGGMVGGKLAAFVLMSASTMVLDRRFHSVPWFRRVEEVLLLCLVGISSIVALSNFGALITLA
jgi:hypothetical protein